MPHCEYRNAVLQDCSRFVCHMHITFSHRCNHRNKEECAESICMHGFTLYKQTGHVPHVKCAHTVVQAYSSECCRLAVAHGKNLAYYVLVRFDNFLRPNGKDMECLA